MRCLIVWISFLCLCLCLGQGTVPTFAQYSTSAVAAMLQTHATSPASTGPNMAATYGNSFPNNGYPNNGYPSGGYPGNSTNGYATPQKNVNQSVVLDGLFAWGRDSKRSKREGKLAEELAAHSATKTVVAPGAKQRFYLTFVMEKSNLYTFTMAFTVPSTTATPFTFYNDKPKNWQPVAR